ncbi:TonB-dependent receptor [Phyllobacterium sp. YR531]|uniref:TonB-dependent receptor domain-containing protein n=1 Tax=Phyllobacterium sp. YR531 TaxID=1144343 RepID=UPI00026F644E|nr:TonB-dependent receptor [Phyllobacterium sp. YR531]EJN02556.1 outer membrane receptor protein [Phyllobacterium sp. YR531]
MFAKLSGAGTIRYNAKELRSILLGAVAILHMVPSAVAQETGRPVIAAQSVSIPAGPLTPALNRLASLTGLQILFDASVANGKSTRGANGHFTPAQALDKILAGTDISARFAGSNQVLLSVSAAPAGPVSVNAGEDSILLDPITIYGARNATTLNATTASVGVVSAEAIEDSQIRYTQDVYRRLANVQDSATVNSGFVIRGMSSEGFVPSGGPAGSLYVDGILQTRYNARFGARNLWDVEQVEVYRGPQSTLSGRSALAGAIYIKTKDPVFEREFELSGTVGSDDLAGGAFVVNTPLVTDQVALRISGSYERSDADVTYSNFDHYAGYDDLITDISGNIRAKLLITPTELPDTRALLTYSYSKDRPNDRLVGLYSGRGDFNNNPDTYTEFRWTEVHNAGLEVTHDFSDALRLTSQTGFQYGINNRSSVDAGTPGYDTGIWGTDDDWIFTQEFRLNYEAERWKWVAGIFGSRQVYDGASRFVAEPYPDAMPGVIYQLDDDQNRKTSNLAVFGEATYEFAPTWFATLGGRLDYLKETNTEKNSFVAFPGPPVFTGEPASFDELNFIPKVGLSKEFGDNHTVGLTYTQGFRSGGSYIDRQTPPNFKVVTYDPEYSQSYELSYKGTLLDDRLTLNANLFYTKYDDQQIEIRPRPDLPGYRETRNAASSRSWGFEIEPTYQVTDQFSAFASIGYLNTKFLEFNHTALPEDQSGKSFPEAPEWSFGFGGRYEFQNGVYVGADAKYTSESNSRFGTKGMYKIDSRFLVNSQVGFKKDNWELTAFVENLTDEKYFTVVDPDAALPFGQAGKRRAFGLNIRTKF